ncbi:MAG: peroxide stress protein YaaA, partial [Emcibacteraceae bacterium]|nr:peroxide stress protein YaaA [Emcibacteraceae bacterium]
GVAKSPGMMVKRARGMMARFVIQNRIENAENLKDFNLDGYRFMPQLSNDTTFEYHKVVSV